MLGTALAQAWYGPEDAQLKRIVDEAAQPYDLLTQNALDQAVKSFADLAREESVWALRYAAYLTARRPLAQDAGLDESECSVRIRELLLRSFSSEADRFRALAGERITGGLCVIGATHQLLNLYLCLQVIYDADWNKLVRLCTSPFSSHSRPLP